MTDETPRCEPPLELRDRDGWHWLERSSDGVQSVAEWENDDWWSFPGEDGFSPGYVAQLGYRYLAPVAAPATVAALVEALEGIRGNFGGTVAVTADDPRAVAIRAALALFRGEAGR